MKMRKRNVVWLTAGIVALIAVLAVTVAFLIGASAEVLSYENVRINDEMYAFWQAFNRRKYVVDAVYDGYENAADTEAFWASEVYEGKTHGELCDELTRDYVARIAVAAYLFDASGGTLSESNKDKALDNLDGTIRDRFGTVEEFDAAAEKYGFTYRAACRAALLEYKRTAILNAYVATTDEQKAYFEENYVRVEMIYVVKPAEGSEAYDRYLMMAEEIRAALAEGEEAFTEIVASDLNPDAGSSIYPDGYYFSEHDVFTVSYRDMSSELMDAVFALEGEGDYAEVTVHITNDEAMIDEDRTYFIRRGALGDLWTAKSKYEEHFFTDFDTYADDAAFIKWRDSMLPDVEWDEENIPAWVPQGKNSDLMKFFNDVR